MNMTKSTKIPSRIMYFTLTVSSALLLTACGAASNTTSSKTESTNQIKIVAAENFYGEVAKAVGGDQVDVTSILDNPNIDPHDFEPTTDVARTVSNAQVIVYDGIGYDAWMDKLIDANSSAKSKSIIKVADDLMGKKQGDNEHVWYDPDTMPKLANKIADDLAKLDPSHAETFKQNAQSYIASLEPLQATVRKLKQTSDVKIAVSEPVFDYMANALHLRIADAKFSKAVDEGTDPSAADVAQLQSDIKGKHVKAFVYNVQNSSPTVDTLVKLAKSSGVPVVEVTETKPKGKTYLQWMTGQLNELGKAFGIQ
jgi:zinc/manganese transport system substrate-binding protein